MARNIKIELYSDDRDFIVDLIYYGLQETVLKKLKRARPNKHGIITCVVDEYALGDMIGYLSLEANHNKKKSVQERACDIADTLELYECQH